ncbi:pentatricopeptide repeat-containing protein At4g21065-like [Rosa rugosa]|uniref:pentatricopeptide repeat-containing protein At4g21065-like n=1 Tax=Rosa rugosa TaxID=74645 RepID=UPI002B411D10|nr:pentatricopeptide repeat-containing protein At4g21065-like [Rosa rugosa]XP_062004663.1 pentatricopeptide repeat-containing protein At4g21065-like [Rosa rugosa]
MLKLKNQAFLIRNHAMLRFPKFTSAAALADTTITQTLIQEVPQPRIQPPKLFITALQSSRNIFHIRQVHAQVAVNGILQNLTVANKLLYMYARHKVLGDAYALFSGMVEKNAVSWSVMVGGFVKGGDFANGFRTFRELIRCGMPPDNYTLPFVIRACRDLMDLKIGRLVHDIVLKHGMLSDNFVCAALVDMYAKCRVIHDARQLFDNMPNRDIVTWTVMIGGFAECRNASESLVLFDRMIDQGVVPDKVTMVTVVNACAKFGAMHKARLVHDYIRRNKFYLDVILGTAMIDMYAKCGCVGSAREIFDRMQVRNVRTWSALIAAYGYHGRGKEALEIFEMMLSSGVLPNAVTFISLLYACSHAGLTEEGLRFFSLMWDEYAVRADVKHYTCMVDLLGRAGKLDEALKLAESMAVEKDEGLWSALLGACRVHGNLDLAEKAASSLLELQPENPGHYVLLSNIYARAGRWKEVAKMRNLMTQRRLKKIPGYTWIEIDDKNYQFGVADRTHPQSENIYAMLKSLTHKLELAGYVPDTNFVLHDVDEEVKVDMLYTHSEKLAIAFGLIATSDGTPIRITKNLRVCGDCHTFSKFVSAITNREIIVRDANRFHLFREGTCSCGDYW